MRIMAEENIFSVILNRRIIKTFCELIFVNIQKIGNKREERILQYDNLKNFLVKRNKKSG
jgi:hypothetical protein